MFLDDYIVSITPPSAILALVIAFTFRAFLFHPFNIYSATKRAIKIDRFY